MTYLEISLLEAYEYMEITFLEAFTELCEELLAKNFCACDLPGDLSAEDLL